MRADGGLYQVVSVQITSTGIQFKSRLAGFPDGLNLGKLEIAGKDNFIELGLNYQRIKLSFIELAKLRQNQV